MGKTAGQTRVRAFTLVEVLIVVVLLTTLVASVLVNGSGGVSRADTKAYAQNLSSALVAARQEAITSSQPVAFVIPSQAGTRPHSQSFYLVSGVNPTIKKVTSLAGEHPKVCSVVGVLFAGSSLSAKPLSTNAAEFDFVAWLGASGAENDYVFCFLPDGSLLTNDLPFHDGEYHILVSAGLDFNTAAPPAGTGWGVAPSYFRPTQVASARMLRISQTGLVSEGPLDGDAGLTTVERLEFATAPAAPPFASPPGTSDPELEGPQVFPVPDPATIPPGIEALVDVDGHLTLSVVAHDPDAERTLYCTWESDRGGPFSKPDEHRMEWDQNARGPALGGWVSRVEWKPPPGTTDGEEFVLTAEVVDAHGGSDSRQIGATGRILAVDEDLIIFGTVRDGIGSLYSMLEDGSDVTRVGELGDRDGLLSAAGDKMLYANGNTLYLRPIGGEPIALITQPPAPTGGPHPGPGLINPAGFNYEGTRIFWGRGNDLYTAQLNADSPIVAYRLNDDPGFIDANGDREIDATLSPDGTKLAYDDGFSVYVADFVESPGPGNPHLPGGGAGTQELTPGRSSGNPSWSLDGNRLFYATNFGGNLDAARADFDPATNTISNEFNLSNHPAQEHPPVVSPDGSQVLFASNRTGNFDIFRVNIDGTGLVNITNHPANDIGPMWGR